MLKNLDIICISSIDWDFLWQQHQAIMSAYAKSGNRVLFIENTGVRAPRLSDVPRIVHRVKRWWTSLRGFRQESENLYIYSPLVLPFPYARVAQWINKRILVSAIRRWMRSVNLHDPVLWSFLPTRTTLDLAKELNHRLLVYYCTDNFSATSAGARKVVRTEQEIIREADLVFAMSRKMVDYCRQFTDHVERVPMGVNTEIFEPVRESLVDPPEDLKDVPGPVIGYVGGVRPSIDKPLVRRIAEEFPECTLAFVGPIQSDVSDLAGYRNIRWLGVKPHHEIPRYIKSFHCCILPYVKDAYTDAISPAKLGEYLIMGKPVVSTNLAEVEAYETDRGGTRVVYVARSHAEFVGLIRQALSEPSASATARIALAREQGWDEKIERMSCLIEGKLAAKAQLATREWEQRLRTLHQAYRRAPKALAGATLALTLGYVIAFHTPLVWIAADPLRIAETPAAADAIVVFGGGVGETGQAGQGYEERVQRAVDLYQQGLASHIIFSTGYAYRFREPFVMQALAVQLGVPADAIVLETRARDTYENVVYSRDILAAAGWRRILLVSSPYHMRRALLVWRKAAPGVRVTATPVVDSGFYGRGEMVQVRHIRALLHEYLAITYYWWKDRI